VPFPVHHSNIAQRYRFGPRVQLKRPKVAVVAVVAPVLLSRQFGQKAMENQARSRVERVSAAAIKCRSIDVRPALETTWQSKPIGAVVIVNSASAVGACEILPRWRERRGGASVLRGMPP
jgi:hypothetical protein